MAFKSWLGLNSEKRVGVQSMEMQENNISGELFCFVSFLILSDILPEHCVVLNRKGRPRTYIHTRGQ